MKIKSPKGRIVIKIDTKQKEKYALTNDVTIHIDRGYNFNRREDYPSRAEVINCENIPEGTTCLVHHNATEPTYHVEAEQILTIEEKEQGYKILSIPEDMLFCYFENDEWQPYKNFLITQRIFKPYKGGLIGIEHEQVKNRLYVVKGMVEEKDLSGKVCLVTDNSDYEIIFHNKDNRPESLIRTREREILGVDHITLDKIKKGELLVGLNQSSAKLFIQSKTNKDAYQTRQQPKSNKRKYSGVSQW